MKPAERLSALGFLVFAVGALAFLFAPTASLTATIAQQTTTNTTSPEQAPEAGAAITEEHEHESSSNETHSDTITVRDSVFALLADQTIPASGFIHLYDSTPYSITSGHVAAKIPCDDDSSPLLNILVGVAPNLTPAPLQLVPPLSTAGELCLYHVNLSATGQANATTANATSANTTTAAVITDIAIQNPGDEDVTLPSTSTVVIGVNEITRGPHTHEGEEGGGQPQAGAP
ncbi:MAG: hypothetical protein M3251_05710 [Thermoproteota archaeon]|nr:hypothetical protein [Thermoproteota archaeon]